MRCLFEPIHGRFPTNSICDSYPDCVGCSYSDKEKPKTFCDTCGHQFSDICGVCETLEGVPVKYEEKPPLGIKPRYIHDHERKLEILDGMERYSNAQKPIPIEWLDELRALILMY